MKTIKTVAWSVLVLQAVFFGLLLALSYIGQQAGHTAGANEPERALNRCLQFRPSDSCLDEINALIDYRREVEFINE